MLRAGPRLRAAGPPLRRPWEPSRDPGLQGAQLGSNKGRSAQIKSLPLTDGSRTDNKHRPETRRARGHHVQTSPSRGRRGSPPPSPDATEENTGQASFLGV